jgi:hypothetical protein
MRLPGFGRPSAPPDRRVADRRSGCDPAYQRHVTAPRPAQRTTRATARIRCRGASAVPLRHPTPHPASPVAADGAFLYRGRSHNRPIGRPPTGGGSAEDLGAGGHPSAATAPNTPLAPAGRATFRRLVKMQLQGYGNPRWVWSPHYLMGVISGLIGLSDLGQARPMRVEFVMRLCHNQSKGGIALSSAERLIGRVCRAVTPAFDPPRDTAE